MYLYDLYNLFLNFVPVGQKFPGKTLELSLQATVHFYDGPVPPGDDDPFCVGLNAYIDVRYQ